MVKVIHIILDDEDYEKLVEVKKSVGASSWRELVMRLAEAALAEAAARARQPQP